MAQIPRHERKENQPDPSVESNPAPEHDRDKNEDDDGTDDDAVFDGEQKVTAAPGTPGAEPDPTSAPNAPTVSTPTQTPSSPSPSATE